VNDPVPAQRDSTPYFQRLRELFDRLSEITTAERATELERAAADDPRLGEELRAMLEHSDRSHSSLDQPTLRLPEPEEFPPPRIPGFRLRRRIGRGGSATVYLADQEHAGFERVVALKVVDHVVGGMSLRQVREEQRILARLEHPGIARLYDAGVTPVGQPYLTMELVEGESILDHCRSRDLPLHARIELFLSVLDAVIYAHSQAIVHRDLKPGNIFVSTRGETKLLDFGIAKLLADDDQDATRTLERAMTPAYASPEQIRGDRITAASDVYSLGLVLYELLSGTIPFRFDRHRAAPDDPAWDPDLEPPSEAFARMASMNHATTAKDRVDLARWRRSLRGDLDAVLLKALRTKPEARYASATAFADDLRRVLAGEPVAARRGDRVYRTRKFLRRHRRIAAALVIALSIVAVQQVSTRWTRSAVSLPNTELAIYHEMTSRHLREGAERLARFDAAGARHSFQRAATSSREQPVVQALAWDGISRSQHVLGETGRASEAARRAGRLIAGPAAGLPSDEAERIRARALAASYDWKAIPILEALFGRQPGRVDVGLDLVSAHLAAGRTDQAENALGRLRQLHADPRIDLVEAEVALRLSEFQRAAAAAARAQARAAQLQSAALGLRAERLHAEAIGRLDQPAEALRNLESVLARDRAAGLVAEAAATRLLIALFRARTSPNDEMRPQFEEALTGLRAAGLRSSEIFALVQLSLLAGRREEFKEALRISDQALQASREIGDRWSEGYVLSQRLVLLNWSDDEIQALQTIEPALAALRDSGNRTSLLATLTNVSSVRIERLELEQAAANLDEAEALARRIGSQPASAKVDRGRGYLQHVRGDLDLARQSFTSALEKGRRGGAPLDVALTLAHLAWLEISADRPDAAAPYAREAMRLLQSSGHAIQAASMEAVLAWVDARRGDAASAERRLASVKKVGAADSASPNFQLLSTEARVAEALGEWSRAVEIRRQTIALAREWSSAGLLLEERHGLARALHGMGNRRELETLVAEMLPEVERLGLRIHARDLRALVATPATR
jgi:serine/threonine protein kinase